MSGQQVIFSFFSGSGFLDLGFEKNGFTIDLVNEFQPEFLRAYKYSRAQMGLREPRFGYWNIDINEFLGIRCKELHQYIDVVHAEGNKVGFIGGPPCPDFSIAGKNRGRNGDNGKLSMIVVTLPSRKQLASGGGILRILDNGPGMTAANAERAIKAGFSGNNPYDTLGLFGMGFNISTGKLGNKTTFMTSRADMDTYIKTVIDLEEINSSKDYSLDALEIPKGDDAPFKKDGHGTIIEVTDWWPEGNANRGFIQKLIQYGAAV